ncbi:MAG: 30S ribosomal protein S4 [uncultured bacterium]|nr:MAG: 30S ribosomal protein S4 [uncultured bacterium]
MARYIGPKNRLARREGVNLDLKTAGNIKHDRRLKVIPGQHGRRGKRKSSEFGIQLREKQKVRRMYGILEKQFVTYYEQAAKTKGATGETLLVTLERRLDNVVYRLGFAPTRQSARQIVSHGHVFVNGKKVSIPSYLVHVEDTVSLSTKSQGIPYIKKLIDEKTANLPGWLEKKAIVGRVSRFPKREDITAAIEDQLIIEYYSR